MIPLWAIKLGAVAILCLAVYGLYWSIDSAGYDRGAADVQGRWDASISKAKDEQAARIKLAQEKHDADQATITRLAADARRVRVNFPRCPSASGENTNGASGVFSVELDSEFAAFQEETLRLIERCDQLNIDAIRKNEGL